MERLSQSRFSEKSRLVTMKVKGEEVDWKQSSHNYALQKDSFINTEIESTTWYVLCVVRQHSSPGALCDDTKKGSK